MATLVLTTGYRTSAQGASGYQVTNTFKIASPGGWDYIAVGPDKKIYVSHGTQVNILDQKTGDSLGVIPNTTGVHGIAFDEALGKGYTSNGRLNTVTVFDLKTSPGAETDPYRSEPRCDHVRPLLQKDHYL